MNESARRLSMVSDNNGERWRLTSGQKVRAPFKLLEQYMTIFVASNAAVTGATTNNNSSELSFECTIATRWQSFAAQSIMCAIKRALECSEFVVPVLNGSVQKVRAALRRRLGMQVFWCWMGPEKWNAALTVTHLFICLLFCCCCSHYKAVDLMVFLLLFLLLGVAREIVTENDSPRGMIRRIGTYRMAYFRGCWFVQKIKREKLELNSKWGMVK